MDYDEIKEIRTNVDRRRAMMIELAKRCDARYRKAKEDFKRPAFAGTILEPRQQESSQKSESVQQDAVQ